MANSGIFLSHQVISFLSRALLTSGQANIILFHTKRHFKSVLRILRFCSSLKKQSFWLVFASYFQFPSINRGVYGPNDHGKQRPNFSSKKVSLALLKIFAHSGRFTSIIRPEEH